MSERRSRRTRGERPEVVPPKEDENPNLEDDYVDEHGNKIALGALRGRRRAAKKINTKTNSNIDININKGATGITTATATATATTNTRKRARRRGHSPSTRSNSPTPSQSSMSMSMSLSVGPRDNMRSGGSRGRHRPNTRSNSPTPSQSSVSMTLSADDIDQEDNTIDNDDDNDDDDGDAADDDDNISSSSTSDDVVDIDDDDAAYVDDDDDDAERDTEDELPKEALQVSTTASSTGRKKRKRKAVATSTKKPKEKVECRQCGKFFSKQGIIHHERKCMPIYTPRGTTTSPSNYENDGNIAPLQPLPPSPVVVVVVNKKKKSFPHPIGKEGVTEEPLPFDPARPYKCRNCGKLYAPQGIKHHERKCMIVYIDRSSKSPDMKQPKPTNQEEDDDDGDISSPSLPVEEQEVEEEEEEESASTTTSPPSSDNGVEESSSKQQPSSFNNNNEPSYNKTTTMYKCRNCGNEFSSRGITRHEKSCMHDYTRREDFSTSSAFSSRSDNLDKSQEQHKHNSTTTMTASPLSIVVVKKKISVGGGNITTGVTDKFEANNTNTDERKEAADLSKSVVLHESKKNNKSNNTNEVTVTTSVAVSGIVDVGCLKANDNDKDKGESLSTSATTCNINNEYASKNHDTGKKTKANELSSSSSISVTTTSGKEKSTANTLKPESESAVNRGKSKVGKGAQESATTTTKVTKKKFQSIAEFFSVKKATTKTTTTDQRKADKEGGEAKICTTNNKGKKLGLGTVPKRKVELSTKTEKRTSVGSTKIATAAAAAAAAIIATTGKVEGGITKTEKKEEQRVSENSDAVVGGARGAVTHEINVTNSVMNVDTDSRRAPPTEYEQEDRRPNKNVAATNTRPTRKRKLTPKAAAAAQVAIAAEAEAAVTPAAVEAAVASESSVAKDEERLFDDSETDDDGNNSVLEKELKSKHGDDDESVPRRAIPPSEGRIEEEQIIVPDIDNCTTTTKRNSLVTAAKNATAATLAAMSSFAGASSKLSNTEVSIEPAVVLVALYQGIENATPLNDDGKEQEVVQENDSVPQQEEIETLPPPNNITEDTTITTSNSNKNDVAMDPFNVSMQIEETNCGSTTRPSEASNLNSKQTTSITSTIIAESGEKGKEHVRLKKKENDKPSVVVHEEKSSNTIIDVEETKMANTNRNGKDIEQPKSKDDEISATVDEGKPSAKIIDVEIEDMSRTKECTLPSTENTNVKVDGNVTNDETWTDEKIRSTTGSKLSLAGSAAETSETASTSVGPSTSTIGIKKVDTERNDSTVTDEAINSKRLEMSDSEEKRANSSEATSSADSNINKSSHDTITSVSASESQIERLTSPSNPNNTALVIATTSVVSCVSYITDNVATTTDAGKMDSKSGESDRGLLSQPVFGNKRPRSADFVPPTTSTEGYHSHAAYESGVANQVNDEEDQRIEEVEKNLSDTVLKSDAIYEDATSIVQDSDRIEKLVRGKEKNLLNTELSESNEEEIDRGTESLTKKARTNDSGDDPQQAGNVIQSNDSNRKRNTTEPVTNDEDGTDGLQRQPKKRARTLNIDYHGVQNVMSDANTNANADMKESGTKGIFVSQNDKEENLPSIPQNGQENLIVRVALQAGVLSEPNDTINVDEVNVVADKSQIDSTVVNDEVKTQDDTNSTDGDTTKNGIINSVEKSVDLTNIEQTKCAYLITDTTTASCTRSNVTSQVEKSIGNEDTNTFGKVDIQASIKCDSRKDSLEDNTTEVMYRGVAKNLTEVCGVGSNSNDHNDTSTNAINVISENDRNDKVIEVKDSDDIAVASRDVTGRENLLNEDESEVGVAKESRINEEAHCIDCSSSVQASDTEIESRSQEEVNESEAIGGKELESSHTELCDAKSCVEDPFTDQPNSLPKMEKVATESIGSRENSKTVAKSIPDDTHREDGSIVEVQPQKRAPLEQTAKGTVPFKSSSDKNERIIVGGPHSKEMLEKIESSAEASRKIESSTSNTNPSQFDETDSMHVGALTATNAVVEVVTTGVIDMDIDGIVSSTTKVEADDATDMDVDETIDSTTKNDLGDAKHINVGTIVECKTPKEPLPETEHQRESNDETIKQQSMQNTIDSPLTEPDQKLSTENSTEIKGIERRSESVSVSGMLHDEPNSTSTILETETTVYPGQSVSYKIESKHTATMEEMKVSWVVLSKLKRKPTPTEDSSSFNGHNESKINRVKILLYSAGSQIHRGRGFERIFSIYWDAVCLRLSGPQSIYVSKQCDQAIAAFLQSKRLKKIHNRFIMGIMRRVMKNIVPYSEVSKHVPLRWQSRIKVPRIVTSTKPSEKKNVTLYNPLNDGMLQISSVPHLDVGTPYKEQWEVYHKATDEILQNPQERSIEPSTSSCIPGALVVDPFFRNIAEENKLEVTDSAMWVLTIALKEHVKNVLKDSIKHKNYMEKAEIYPQSLHYPNLLSSVASKIRKESRAKTATATAPQEEQIGRKKQINSMDVFSALNMLPSAHVGSIGGSISRVSLEQTFLSAFNSMPSFIAWNDFRDVQGFVSNTIIDMAKNRKPEERKMRVSQTKCVEKKTERSRQPRPTSDQEEKITKKSSENQVPLPNVNLQSSTKSSGPIIQVAESPAFVYQLSPAGTQTTAVGSDLHGVVSSPEHTMASPQIVDKLQSQTGKVDSIKQQLAMPPLASSKTSSTDETKETEEKPQTVPPVSSPTRLEPQRPGAGRGAKNLAALMARAAGSNKQKEPIEEDKSTKKDETIATGNDSAIDTAVSKIKNSVQSNNFMPATAVPGGDTPKVIDKKSNQLKNQENVTDVTTDSPKNEEVANTKIETVIENKGVEKDEKPVENAPISQRSGAGRGAKNLAALMARAAESKSQTEP